jgi:transposase
MIALTAQTRIWIAREPADFRCGIDGLAKICRTVLKSDPFICGGREYVAAEHECAAQAGVLR